jgi:hypothetical protein
MSPRISKAKAVVTKTQDGRLLIAVRLRTVTPFVSICQLLHASECEPVRLLHETEDQYIDRLYSCDSNKGGR